VNRVFSALAEGKNYQKPLLDAINEIEERSKDLIRQAQISDITGSRDATRRILEENYRQGHAVEVLTAKVDSLQNVLNEVKELFDNGARNRERQISQFMSFAPR
jgi:hypothetical protein